MRLDYLARGRAGIVLAWLTQLEVREMQIWCRQQLTGHFWVAPVEFLDHRP
jgi:hypothetical protein